MYCKYTEKMKAFGALLPRRYRSQSVLWCKYILHKLKGTQEIRGDCIWVSRDFCYTTLHYTTLHYTTLHYTTLHYTTLHYTTLHYIRPSEKLIHQKKPENNKCKGRDTTMWRKVEKLFWGNRKCRHSQLSFCYGPKGTRDMEKKQKNCSGRNKILSFKGRGLSLWWCWWWWWLLRLCLLL